jgi:hypothetical protein
MVWFPHRFEAASVTLSHQIAGVPMQRKVIAVLVSAAFLATSIAANAAPAPQQAEPAHASTPQTTTPAKNRAPLPAGPARIKTAQGLEDDDLGPGVIMAAWAVAVGIAFAVAFSGGDDDNNTPPTTGTH